MVVVVVLFLLTLVVVVAVVVDPSLKVGVVLGGGLQRTVRSTQCTKFESGDDTRAKTNPSPTPVAGVIVVVVVLLLLRVDAD